MRKLINIFAVVSIFQFGTAVAIGNTQSVSVINNTNSVIQVHATKSTGIVSIMNPSFTVDPWNQGTFIATYAWIADSNKIYITLTDKTLSSTRHLYTLRTGNNYAFMYRDELRSEDDPSYNASFTVENSTTTDLHGGQSPFYQPIYQSGQGNNETNPVSIIYVDTPLD